ncbi:hypothetical protein D3C84_817820 [compost metagenome]
MRCLPQQTQVARRLPRQADFMLLDPLIGKGQSRDLPFSPGLPVLQIVTGLDGEALEAVALAGPVEDQLLQRRLDCAGIEQPAAQLFLACLQLTGRLHFDQRAVVTRLHPHARRVLGGVRRVVQREPFDVGQRSAVFRLGSGPRQGVGL